MGFTKTLVKTGLAIKKYSPAILAVLGTVSTIAGVVAACKTASDTAEETKAAKEEIADIKERIKEVEDKKSPEVKDAKKSIWTIRMELMKKVGPRYLIAALLVVLGLLGLHASRMIVTYWLNGTSAAYISLENRYQMLEDGVREEYGEEALERLKYGYSEALAEIRTTDDKGVSTSEIRAFNDLVDTSKVKSFALVFDKNSDRYVGDAEHDLAYILSQTQIYNQLLKTKGAVNLIDITQNLDIRPKDEDQLKLWRNIFWIDNPEDPNKDCHIDLRPVVVHDQSDKNYRTGYNSVIVMDPNFDLLVTNGDYSEVFKHMR